MNKNKLIQNIFSLSLAEVATKGITFFLTAYIAKIFDVEGYGIINYIQAVLTYMTLVVNLGFGIVGARAVAQNPTDQEKYVNNIITIKLLIAVLTFAAMCGYTLFVDKPAMFKIALMLGGLQVFACAIQIDWFYQGIEKMKILGARQFLVSALTFVGVIIFVKSPDDIPVYMCIASCSLILNSLWLLILYIKKYAKIKLTVKWAFWKELLKSAVSITVSSAFFAIINSFHMIYLTYIEGDYANGLFAAAAKLGAILFIPAAILQSVFLPSIARASAEERRDVVLKYSKTVAVAAAIIPTIVFTYADFFIVNIFDEKFIPAAIILRIFMINTVMAYYDSTIYTSLMAWGKERKMLRLVAIAAAISVLVNMLLVPVMSGKGAALSVVASELFLLITTSVLIYKQIRALAIGIFIKTLAIAVISALITTQLLIFIHNSIVEIIVTFAIFAILILAFKVIKISELKGIFAK